MFENQEKKPVIVMNSPLEMGTIDLPVATPRSLGRLRAGELCPQCQTERLDYDGLLNLACPKCGVVAGGCFT